MSNMHLLAMAFLSVTSVGLVAPAVTAQSANLTGHIVGLKDKPVIFRYTQRGVQKRDTVFGKNDRFTYQPKPSDDGRINLFISYPRYTSFWYEPGTLMVTGAIEKPYKLTITGGKENDVYSQFQQTVEWVYDDKKQGKSGAALDSLTDQQHRATLTFIRQHPAAQISAYLLYWEAITDQKRVAEHQQLNQQLAANVQAGFYGKEAARKIQSVINQPVVGRKAPNFSLPDTTGTISSLTTYKGKYVLLDFWGHWCGPCLRAFPKLKAIEKNYAGKLVLIGIAAEFADDKANWTSTIRKYNASWLQVSELKGDKGAVNEQYNVTAFPTYLLLDKDGMVIERANDLEAIERKLTTVGD